MKELMDASFPVDNNMIKVNNKDTTTRCGICSKSTIKAPEPCRSSVFIVNFEQISHC